MNTVGESPQARYLRALAVVRQKQALREQIMGRLDLRSAREFRIARAVIDTMVDEAGARADLTLAENALLRAGRRTLQRMPEYQANAAIFDAVLSPASVGQARSHALRLLAGVRFVEQEVAACLKAA